MQISYQAELPGVHKMLQKRGGLIIMQMTVLYGLNRYSDGKSGLKNPLSICSSFRSGKDGISNLLIGKETLQPCWHDTRYLIYYLSVNSLNLKKWLCVHIHTRIPTQVFTNHRGKRESHSIR